MPMLVETKSCCSAKVKGGLRHSRIRSDSCAATLPLLMFSISTTNSSPPRRASVSSDLRHPCKRFATAPSSRSPASWPKESFMYLKLSRSMKRTAR